MCVLRIHVGLFARLLVCSHLDIIKFTFTLHTFLFSGLKGSLFRMSEYTLQCPGCDSPLHNMWWKVLPSGDGYFSCSTCIEFIKKICPDDWTEFSSQSEYRQNSFLAWRRSYYLTRALLISHKHSSCDKVFDHYFPDVPLGTLIDPPATVMSVVAPVSTSASVVVAAAATMSVPPVPPFNDDLSFSENNDDMSNAEVSAWMDQLLDFSETPTKRKRVDHEIPDGKRKRQHNRSLRERAEIIVNYVADLKRSVKEGNTRRMQINRTQQALVQQLQSLFTKMEYMQKSVAMINRTQEVFVQQMQTLLTKMTTNSMPIRKI